MKALLSIVLAAGLAFGATIKVNENLATLKVNDQFDKPMAVTNDTKKIIVAFSKEKGEEIKAFLDANPNFLKDENALYFADVSAAPSFVTSIFMVPKFKKYSYKMGLIRDEDVAATFPKQEEMMTIISLKDSVVTNIEFKKQLP